MVLLLRFEDSLETKATIEVFIHAILVSDITYTGLSIMFGVAIRIGKP